MPQNLCDTFLNRPLNSYIPLRCRPLIVTSRELRSTGRANKAELFFITKPNTIREHATVDLLYPKPFWLDTALHPDQQFREERITTDNQTRVIDTGLIRVTL